MFFHARDTLKPILLDGSAACYNTNTCRDCGYSSFWRVHMDESQNKDQDGNQNGSKRFGCSRDFYRESLDDGPRYKEEPPIFDEKTGIGIYHTIGLRPTQEDEDSIGYLPGWNILSDRQKDEALKNTVARLQKKYEEELERQKSMEDLDDLEQSLDQEIYELNQSSNKEIIADKERIDTETISIKTIDEFEQMPLSFNNLQPYQPLEKIGSTFISTIIDGNQLTTVYLGDSVSFLIILNENYEVVRKERLNKNLHNPDDESESERLESVKDSFLYVKNDCVRLGSGLAVSRGFGDKYSEAYGLIHEPEIDKITFDIPKYGKAFIICACDGLTESDCLNLDDIAQFISDHGHRMLNELGNTAKLLAQKAIEKGSQDNVSVLIISLTQKDLSLDSIPKYMAIFDGHNGNCVSKMLSKYYQEILLDEINKVVRRPTTENCIKMARIGINNYQNILANNVSGFIGNPSDYVAYDMIQELRKRTGAYQQLLLSHMTLFEKMGVVFALLTDAEVSDLQSSVAEIMGFKGNSDGIKAAKERIYKIIERGVNSSNSLHDKKLMKIFFDNIVVKLKVYLDSCLTSEECYLYLISPFPENLERYKGSYIFNEEDELKYVDFNGKAETAKFNYFDSIVNIKPEISWTKNIYKKSKKPLSKECQRISDEIHKYGYTVNEKGEATYINCNNETKTIPVDYFNAIESKKSEIDLSNDKSEKSITLNKGHSSSDSKNYIQFDQLDNYSQWPDLSNVLDKKHEDILKVLAINGALTGGIEVIEDNCVRASVNQALLFSNKLELSEKTETVTKYLDKISQNTKGIDVVDEKSKIGSFHSESGKSIILNEKQESKFQFNQIDDYPEWLSLSKILGAGQINLLAALATSGALIGIEGIENPCRRVSAYQQLLLSSKIGLFEKNVVISVLLADSEIPELQNSVAETMGIKGLNKIEIAKNCINYIMQADLQCLYIDNKDVKNKNSKELEMLFDFIVDKLKIYLDLYITSESELQYDQLKDCPVWLELLQILGAGQANKYITGALIGVDEYEDSSKYSNRFFSKKLSEDDRMHIDNFKQLLLDQMIKPYEKYVIIYLFIANDIVNENLKVAVSCKMGFGNVEQAKESLKAEFKNRLHGIYNGGHETALEVLGKVIMSKIFAFIKEPKSFKENSSNDGNASKEWLKDLRKLDSGKYFENEVEHKEEKKSDIDFKK